MKDQVLRGPARAAGTGTLAVGLDPYRGRWRRPPPPLHTGLLERLRSKATRLLEPNMMETDDSLHRHADPKDIADAVAFLAGPRARLIHAQALRADGGLMLFPG